MSQIYDPAGGKFPLTNGSLFVHLMNPSGGTTSSSESRTTIEGIIVALLLFTIPCMYWFFYIKEKPIIDAHPEWVFRPTIAIISSVTRHHRCRKEWLSPPCCPLLWADQRSLWWRLPPITNLMNDPYRVTKSLYMPLCQRRSALRATLLTAALKRSWKMTKDRLQRAPEMISNSTTSALLDRLSFRRKLRRVPILSALLDWKIWNRDPGSLDPPPTGFSATVWMWSAPRGRRKTRPCPRPWVKVVTASSLA